MSAAIAAMADIAAEVAPSESLVMIAPDPEDVTGPLEADALVYCEASYGELLLDFDMPWQIHRSGTKNVIRAVESFENPEVLHATVPVEVTRIH